MAAQKEYDRGYLDGYAQAAGTTAEHIRNLLHEAPANLAGVKAVIAKIEAEYKLEPLGDDWVAELELPPEP